MSATTTLRARNIANASHSTGPTTEQGKSRSSQNAVKHGIFCKALVLPGEDPGHFKEFRLGMIASLCPQNTLELELVEQIVADQWRARRIRDAESDEYRLLIEKKKEKFEQEQQYRPKAKRQAYSIPDSGSLVRQMMNYTGTDFDRFQKYEQRYVASANRCLNQLRQLRKDQNPQPNEFTQALLAPEDASEEVIVKNEARKPNDECEMMNDESKNDPNHHSSLSIHHSKDSLEPSPEGIMEAKRDPDV